MKYRQVRILQDNGADIRSIKNNNAFAKKVGIDRGELSKALREKIVISERLYCKIKKALDATIVSEIFKDKDEVRKLKKAYKLG